MAVPPQFSTRQPVLACVRACLFAAALCYTGCKILEAVNWFEKYTGKGIASPPSKVSAVPPPPQCLKVIQESQERTPPSRTGIRDIVRHSIQQRIVGPAVQKNTYLSVRF